MAKQVGPLFFTGTIDGIIFYKVGDQYYTRSKGSYKSAKHMRRNPKYKRTMEKADQFGEASTITKDVYYRHVPKSARVRGVYGTLTGMLTRWLQEGKSAKEAQELLVVYCQTLSIPTEQPVSINAQPKTTQSKVVQRTTVNAQLPTNTRPKQARYLSNWKVKKNGKLHIPISPSHHSLVIPHQYQAELVYPEHSRKEASLASPIGLPWVTPLPSVIQSDSEESQRRQSKNQPLS